ncbi:transposase [Flammeovirgaceae bacterium SG7u.111]|nr:transposase [Flammeovirgaceae bacterium SG7u.132]WPO38730.1 transposase [Flammeovirgaceae bacterium SG7u.111]
METGYTRLTARQWQYIKEYLPVERKRKYDLRDVVDSILYCMRSGQQWRSLSGEGRPPWNVVWNVYIYWYGNKRSQSRILR